MKTILIIDDSAFMRNILKDILSDKVEIDQPIEIDEADGRKNALKLLAKIKPDIIFVDIVMGESETEGLEFLQSINGSFDLSKVVVISSVGQTHVVNECNKLGVSAYIQKPFDPNEIVEAIKKLL